MQTFFPYLSVEKTAKCLDYRRLGKQRIEAIQIVDTLCGVSTGWQNHPNVKRWKGHEGFLVRVYLREIMKEWERRGYRNDKCNDHFNRLLHLLEGKNSLPPPWLTEEFCVHHRIILLIKDRNYYARKFKEIESLYGAEE